jgi:hypothetical protein
MAQMHDGTGWQNGMMTQRLDGMMAQWYKCAMA